MSSPSSRRPELTADLPEQEFLRWYWLKAELQVFARELGVRTTGSKTAIADRIGAALDGRTIPEPASSSRPAGRQLSEPLTPATTIPVGQRCSQVVRAWMQGQVGADFHFDARMREFFARSDGTKTLQDAVEHYYATRGGENAEIGSQFEYNRFTRDWYKEHPRGTRAQLLAAWRDYRETPVDKRESLRKVRGAAARSSPAVRGSSR